jgi:3'-phosphoadenosine 5'-phosphosulfate sulfotransferase (PAPS reductase)/FAD synthetase
MALMAAAGEITPMPTAAIFADTQDEPQSVYRWLDWLEKQLPFPVYRVTAGRLSDGATRIRTSRKGVEYYDIKLPYFTRAADGKQGMMGMRNCTEDYKILPIRRCMRKLAGPALAYWRHVKRAYDRSRPKLTGSFPPVAFQWIGISLDEVQRMKTSRDQWIENRWPLIDAKMSRHDCLRWMDGHGFPKPPRSACVYCPFHSNAEWRRLRQEEPVAFQSAVDFEKRAQNAQKKSPQRTEIFLHRSLKPLDQVDFSTDIENGQGMLAGFGNECEGMCGV